jgi:hypothetical protein
MCPAFRGYFDGENPVRGKSALAHVVGDQTEQAYRRGDALEKRRKLMDDWASYCEQPPARGPDEVE